MQIANLVGKIGEFHSEHELIRKRFTLYVAANSVPAEKKVAVLLTVIRPKTYNLLRNFSCPVFPQNKTYTQLDKFHFMPKPIAIAEYFQF